MTIGNSGGATSSKHGEYVPLKKTTSLIDMILGTMSGTLSVTYYSSHFEDFPKKVKKRMTTTSRYKHPPTCVPLQQEGAGPLERRFLWIFFRDNIAGEKETPPFDGFVLPIRSRGTRAH